MADAAKKPIHEQPALCDHIIRSASSTTVTLRIGPSSIIDAGSGLFVLEHVPAGTDIFRSEPLLLVCESDKQDVCDYCFLNKFSPLHPDGRFVEVGEKSELKILACDRCKSAQYCSKECQALAWKSHHKYECTVLQKVKEHKRHMGALPQTLCRLLLLMKKRAISMSDLKVLTQLETHVDGHTRRWEKTAENDDNLEATYAVAATMKQLTRSNMDTARVRELYCMLVTNSAAVVPAEWEDGYGDCLDLLLSLVNHSCAANAHVFFEGRELRCRALQDIPAGGEVTVHYHPNPRKDVLLRRKFLREQLFITCNCKKCKEEMAAHIEDAVDRQDHLRIVQQAQLDLQNARLSFEARFDSCRLVQVCIDFQKEMWAIVQRGYPEGCWPNSLEPLPAAYLSLGTMYWELKYALGLEFVLKGTIYSRDRKHPIYVRELLYLTKFIIYVAQAGEDDIKWTAATENAELLDRETMRAVARGYTCIVTLAGKFAFGMDNNLVQAMHKWASEILDYPGDPELGTEVFQERFRVSQERLLTWANMRPDIGLSLPSSHEITQLKRQVEAVRVENA